MTIGLLTMFFDGFPLTSLEMPRPSLPDGRFRLRMAGAGPIVLLLHGSLQTHAMWHAVAPRLARHFTVICPDLRGHGGSVKPLASEDHAAHGSAAMAEDMIALMEVLAPGRSYGVVGHDRGALVALSMALAAPDRVRGLVALDAVPDAPKPEVDMAAALGTYKGLWFFEPRPLAEQVVSLAPDVWFSTHDAGRPEAGGFFAPEALADYVAAAESESAMVGLREGLRAAATIDRLEQAIARGAGRKVLCPVLVLWGSAGSLGRWYDPRDSWRGVCANEVTGEELDAGHYLAEECPGQVSAALEGFFRT